MATKHMVHVYDPDGSRLKVIASVRNARYRLAENEVGDFELVIPYGDGSVPSVLVPPNHVEFWRNDVYVFGGVIRSQGITQEGRTADYTVSGPSYMTWLADARHKSATGTGDISYTSDNMDDLIKKVVRDHVLDTNSKFVVAADSGLSAVSDTYVASGYETVLETLQGMATRAEDTTFDIIRDTDRQLRFRTWTPSRGPDKSKGQPNAVLLDLVGGNVQRFEWKRDGTSVINAQWGAGGNANKAARYIWPSGDAHTDSASILEWGRIEGFIDAGTESTTNVQKKVQDTLKESAVPEEYVNVVISEFGRYQLGVDFDYGTRVTAQLGDFLELTDTIMGMEVRLTEGNNIASIDINIGDTLTGDEPTRAAIKLGRFLRKVRRGLDVVTRR